MMYPYCVVTLFWMFLSVRNLRSTALLVVEYRCFTSVGSSSKFMSSSDRGGGRGRGGRGGGGRGEYYKNKYGGGGRGRGGGGRGRGGSNNNDAVDSGERTARGGGSYEDLIRRLQRLDGKPYAAYHDLDTPADQGWVNSDSGFTLFVERAQTDPFARPTRCRMVINASHAKFPPESYSNKIRSVAVADYLQRALYASCKILGADAALSGQGWSGPKGGDVHVLEPCQHVLEQSAVRIDPSTGAVIAQVTINLPARGRTILGQAAENIFGQILPMLVQQSLYYSSLQPSKLKQHVESIEDQLWLQNKLESKNLVAFVPNGAILPRLSGVDDRPMPSSSAVLFESPKRLEVAFTLPNAGTIVRGMGIPKGITLICGGGFHGKSTLLAALQVGVYPKVPGDGRVFCVTSPQAFKIRAEDGRGVQAVDISPFINNLPFGKDTTCFSTSDASGSTSQAANIIESVEIGADTLLIDEDTCATNFMIRDDKMMQLVAPEKEPITPFVRVVRSLYDDHGISSILVIGGVGDYFDVADNVIMMDCYKCLDVTERAKQIVATSAESKLPHTASACVPFRKFHSRYPIGSVYSANGKVKVYSRSSMSYGETELDLSGLEQIVTQSQTTAISQALQRLPSIATDRNNTLCQVLEALDKVVDEGGLDVLAPNQFHGGMARPRRFELAGAINRLRRDGSVVQKR